MLVRVDEYHPYAACLMFMGCHDGEVVRANLLSVQGSGAQAECDLRAEQRSSKELACKVVNDMGRFIIIELPAPATHDERKKLATLCAKAIESRALPAVCISCAESFNLTTTVEPSVSVEKSFEGTRCPFTKRPYFMHIEHPELGRVPTYGGPFDSYTIPVPDDDGERTLRVERYDHDAGDWVEGGEPLRLHVVTDEEFAKLCTAEPPSALHSFKNFHRLLCERFGYFHDDQDWQRDQLSLIEHIASRLGQEPSSEFLSDLSNVLEMAKERESIFDMRSFIIDALTMIANHTVTKSEGRELLEIPPFLRAWVDCPACGEKDMRQENGAIHCTNEACPSKRSAVETKGGQSCGD